MEKYKLGKLPIEMPTGWHEVPFETGLEIMRQETLNEVKILSLLTGQTEKVIRSATDAATIVHFANAFDFVNRMPRNLRHPEMPRSMKFRGEERIILPYTVYGDRFDLGKASTGQVQDMKLIIAEAGS